MKKHSIIVSELLLLEYQPLIGTGPYTLYQYYLFQTEKGKLNPSIRQISKDTRLSTDSIIEYNQILEKFELITIIPGGRRRPNGYITNRPNKHTLERIKKEFY